MAAERRCAAQIASPGGKLSSVSETEEERRNVGVNNADR